ncbi:MAG: hypothetical protein IPK68_10005 [Bdellovibrionales bacterium]|nr:hypothetical protein [Bdellovibrionales bacterium]
MLVDQVAKLLNLATTNINCACLSPPGYRGYDLSVSLKNLIAEAGIGGVERASTHSCLIFDELDKLKRRGKDDDFIKQIEFSLLPVFSGEKLIIDQDENGESQPIQFSTYGALVIAMGVFPEISKTVWTDPNRARRALVKYGFSIEFVSRITHIIQLKPLRKEDVERLVEREVKSLGSTYQSGANVPEMPVKQIKAIANFAAKSEFGIRGARLLIHELLQRRAHAEAIDNLV